MFSLTFIPKETQVKGVPFPMEGVQKEYDFQRKTVPKQGKGLDIRAKPSRKNFCWVVPSPNRTSFPSTGNDFIFETRRSSPK